MGPRLLLTRPLADARRFLQDCERDWGPIDAVLAPLMAIVPVDPGELERPGSLLLTSRHGARRAGELGLAGLPALCVGPATARAAEGAGLVVQGMAADADALVALALDARPPRPLHLRGLHARGDVAGRLREAGVEAAEAVAYRQDALDPPPEARAALEGAAPLLVPLFSPRSAALLAALAPRAPLHVVALSLAVAEAARALRPETLAVAEAPEARAMRRATLQRLAALRAPGPAA